MMLDEQYAMLEDKLDTMLSGDVSPKRKDSFLRFVAATAFTFGGPKVPRRVQALGMKLGLTDEQIVEMVEVANS